jgi:hypothetical protein
MITLTREEAQWVLGVLEQENSIYAETDGDEGSDVLIPVIEMLRARLSAPEPEPVAWMNEGDIGRTDWKVWAHGKPTATIPLYTALPQREWQGLTAKDLAEIPPSCFEGAIWADAKLKEKNT